MTNDKLEKEENTVSADKRLQFVRHVTEEECEVETSVSCVSHKQSHRHGDRRIHGNAKVA
jgi:hypothetical protein